MDAIRRRLRDDLRGHFRGELLLDEIARRLYATDASLFEIEPLAVAQPLDEDDLRVLIQYTGEQQIPIIARGAGTGVAGEALGTGLIVDLSVHFRSILEIEHGGVRVQPGVTLRGLNAELAKHGRRFAPDPASGAICTIGGMLATNASGSNVLVHGWTGDHVESLRVMWDDGESAIIGPVSPAISGNGKPHADDGPRTVQITNSVRELLYTNAELIRASQPRTPFNRCGYLLRDALTPAGIDLTKILVGSEGTLAFFTEAVLRTIPLSSGRSGVLFGFDGIESALRAADFIRPMQPSACDLLDRRLLSLVRGQSPEIAKLIPVGAETVVFVEFERDGAEEARQAGLEIIDQVQRQQHLAVVALPAFDDAAISRLWQIREAALPALYALGRGPRPLAFVEDIGVPPEATLEFINRLQPILQKFETTASFMIHAATGQVHARPFLDLNDPTDVEKLWAIAEQVHALAIEMGGTVSTQHGTGIARTPWVEKQYGRLFPVFRELKAIFDPRGLLNPGKIVGLDPSRPAWPLRTRVAERRDSLVEPAPVPEDPKSTGPARESRILLWQSDEVAAELTACNGCGSCRTESAQQRMCPTFRVTHREAATPRAKANLLRQVLGENRNGKTIGADEVREVADLCINCRMCAQECPAHVNIPKLMLEAKAANHAEHGLSRADWIISRMEATAGFGSNFALMTNMLMGSKIVRWFMEKAFGFSRERRIPSFAARTFLKRAKRRGWSRKPRRWQDKPRVAYFVDLFPNVFDPSIAEATVAVLQHHGFDVLVPSGQKASGMAPLSVGDVELARETVRHNLRLFADLAREGYTIICSEPTAAIMLRQDLPSLIDDPDAALVAKHTVELTDFLWRLHREGKLRTDFAPLDFSVGHHVPCHIKALGAGVHGPDLLALIPRLTVNTIDVSCSGMAGTFGLLKRSYQASFEAGQPMLDELKRPRSLFGSTECGACRIQMEQGSGKRTLHPVQYMALSYGLLPEVARRLRQPL